MCYLIRKYLWLTSLILGINVLVVNAQAIKPETQKTIQMPKPRVENQHHFDSLRISLGCQAFE
jgi:hypothetical protein